MDGNSKTTVFGSGLIWFGAAVSIAEILAGTLFASMKLWNGIAAIVIGHIIGCALLCAAGLVGAKCGRSAMESVKLTFGDCGGRLFAGLNVIQLVGWTAVMLSAGAQAAQTVWQLSGGEWLWTMLLGGLVLLWLMCDAKALQKINIVAVALLFMLSVLLSWTVLMRHGSPASCGNPLGFGEALELSIAMPVSWLPLIADYTSNSTRPRLSSLTSAVVYCAVSCWMYLIGMVAARCAGQGDIAVVMAQAGLGLAAVAVVVLSTVTTTFMDVHSAGLSASSVSSRLPARKSAVFCGLTGIVLAAFCNAGAFENFLYWIGSVFVPMATVQIMDSLVLGRRRSGIFAGRNLMLWGIGFILYRIALNFNLSCGSTIPVIVVTSSLCWLCGSWRRSASVTRKQGASN